MGSVLVLKVATVNADVPASVEIVPRVALRAVLVVLWIPKSSSNASTRMATERSLRKRPLAE